MKRIVFYDIEVYPNFFCCTFLENNTYYSVGREKLHLINFNDPTTLFIGFNNRTYDQPIIDLALQGAPESMLYALSYNIIENKQKEWSFNKNIVDLLQICPALTKDKDQRIICSLKEFGHRMGYKYLKNLPYPYGQNLSAFEQNEVKKYSCHDVKITSLLWEKLKSEYEARQGLKLFFDITTEFAKVPQLAQKCIEFEMKGKIKDKDTLSPQSNLILSPQMRSLYDEAFAFPMERYLEKEKPDFMENEINKSSTYNVNNVNVKFGIGGLHGLNKKGVYRNVWDYDVSSYYASIILQCKLGSESFRKVFQRIYDNRIKLKKEMHLRAKTFKMVLNSMFGKLLSPYSPEHIRAENIGITICLLGQFYLIDLIEKIPTGVIIANTDGIVTESPIPFHILEEWQHRTGFELESTQYSEFVVANSNSFYAKSTNGTIKRKKDFLVPVWDKVGRAPIIQSAALNYLLHNIPIEQTVKSCHTIYDFCFFVKAPKGKSLLLDGQELRDPRVRYYCSTVGHVLERKREKSPIKIRADSPITLCMDLEMTTPINYDWYLNEADKLIKRVL